MFLVILELVSTSKCLKIYQYRTSIANKIEKCIQTLSCFFLNFSWDTLKVGFWSLCLPILLSCDPLAGWIGNGRHCTPMQLCLNHSWLTKTCRPWHTTLIDCAAEASNDSHYWSNRTGDPKTGEFFTIYLPLDKNEQLTLAGVADCKS